MTRKARRAGLKARYTCAVWPNKLKVCPANKLPLSCAYFWLKKWIPKRAAQRPVHAFNPSCLIGCEATTHLCVSVCVWCLTMRLTKKSFDLSSGDTAGWRFADMKKKQSVHMFQNVDAWLRDVYTVRLAGFPARCRRECPRQSCRLVKYLICKPANCLKSLHWVAIHCTRHPRNDVSVICMRSGKMVCRKHDAAEAIFNSRNEWTALAFYIACLVA